MAEPLAKRLEDFRKRHWMQWPLPSDNDLVREAVEAIELARAQPSTQPAASPCSGCSSEAAEGAGRSNADPERPVSNRKDADAHGLCQPEQGLAPHPEAPPQATQPAPGATPVGAVPLTDIQIGEAWSCVKTHDDQDTFRAGVRFAEQTHGILSKEEKP